MFFALIHSHVFALSEPYDEIRNGTGCIGCFLSCCNKNFGYETGIFCVWAIGFYFFPSIACVHKLFTPKVKTIHQQTHACIEYNDQKKMYWNYYLWEKLFLLCMYSALARVQITSGNMWQQVILSLTTGIRTWEIVFLSPLNVQLLDTFHLWDVDFSVNAVLRL